MVRGFKQIAVLTVFSRIAGMVRDMTFAHFLGAGGLMDGWTIGFQIPNLARRLFGEGAAASSLIPVYSAELQRDREQANRLAMTVTTAILVLLTAVVVLGEAGIWLYYRFSSPLPGARIKLALTGLMLPYMIMVCVGAILAGVLNTHRHFAGPAALPVVLNLFLIAALYLTGKVLGLPERVQVFAAAGAVLFSGLAQYGLLLPPLVANKVRLRPAWDIHSDAFRKVILLMGPMVIGLTATQINTLADNLTALWLSGSAEKGATFSLLGSHIRYPLWEGAVSCLFYAQRLYQFPLGVFGISLATAIFPVMSGQAARKDLGALSQTVASGLRGAIFIALPATTGLILIAKPVVAAIFQHGKFTPDDTAQTAFTLCFYCLGLSGYFAQQVLTRAFYAMQQSSVPAKSAAAAVLVNVCLNLTLVWVLGTGGLAASTAICSYLQVTVLIIALRKRLSGEIVRGVGVAALQTAAATAVMAGGVLATMRVVSGHGHAVALLLPMLVGGAVFVLAAAILRIEMLSLLVPWKTRKDREAATAGADV